MGLDDRKDVFIFGSVGDVGVLYFALTFLFGAVIWVIIAALVAAAGKITDYLQNNQEGISRIFVVPFFVVAIGMITYGAVIYFLSIAPVKPFPFTTTDGIIAMMLLTVMGLAIAFMGIYFRPRVQKRVQTWMEIRERLEEEESSGNKGKPVYKKVKY